MCEGHLPELQEKMEVLAGSQIRKAELNIFEGNTIASRSQEIWKGFNWKLRAGELPV